MYLSYELGNNKRKKLIHKKYDTITINEYNTSKKCCDWNNELEYYKDKEGKKVLRLLAYSNSVSCENKKSYLEPEMLVLL